MRRRIDWLEFKDRHLVVIRRLAVGLCNIADEAQRHNEGIETRSEIQQGLQEILRKTKAAINSLQRIRKGKDI